METDPKWYYYNHALLPNCAPHKEAEVKVLNQRAFWKSFTPNRPLLASWTSNYDCGVETGWWYCILDKPFSMAAISSNRRTKLKQAIRNFAIKIIDVKLFAEQMFEVHKLAWQTYSKTGKFDKEKENFCKEVQQWEDTVFGAFDKETRQLVAYYRVKVNEDYIDLITLKSDPSFEKKRVNLAIMFYVYNFFSKDIENGKYLCGGSRSVYHQTNFQEFREKNFGFRKAYTHLHIKYIPIVSLIIKLLYPIRKMIKKIPLKIANQISGILLMEEVCRNQ